MLSKAAGVNYDRSAVCERWERFINEIMIEDLEKALFLQKALGYALTGDTKYEALFILFGPTSRNGKGTACETFLRIIGDYGRTARPESIGMKFNSSSGNPTEDIARLAGSRFVNISEPDKKLVLSAALVKSLTGNDSINARFLHENSFDFKPQFKLFINCNYLPQVTDLTLFHSGRVKIIPFERHFEESDQDHSLKATFAKPENLSGILNWCIKGYHLMVKEGLKMPESVRLATDAYQHSSDKIGLFIEDCMEPDPRAEVRTAEVYSEYKSWCMENGYRQENVKNFNAALRSIMPIERRRPRDGGAMTTMITGHKLLYGFDKVAPL
jgi:putative DNA primase/helicase